MSVVPQPKVVTNLLDAVTAKLGRPAHFRKVLNRDEWYVYDPVLSFVSRGKGRVLGYRVGYRVALDDREVTFALVHNRVLAILFKHNLVMSTMVDVIRRTASFRKAHWVYRNSKFAHSKGLDDNRIEASSLTEFLVELESFDSSHGFVRDMFPKRENTGNGRGTPLGAGNTFFLLLADKIGALKSKERADQLVDDSRPLFLCLYPKKPIEGRSASLARSLRVRGIPKACEFSVIKTPRDTEISPLCRGTIQGAHIKPDWRSGSDRPENGIWLCEYHHRSTEGKLKGRRNGLLLEVKLVPAGLDPKPRRS
jgi:hypothetical protein